MFNLAQYYLLPGLHQRNVINECPVQQSTWLDIWNAHVFYALNMYKHQLSWAHSEMVYTKLNIWAITQIIQGKKILFLPAILS